MSEQNNNDEKAVLNNETAQANAALNAQTVDHEASDQSSDQPSDQGNDEDFPPIPKEELDRIRADIIAAIKTVYDPEIPVDIYELGLIYTVEINNDRSVHVDMTLTSPGCPVAGEMPEWVVNAVVKVDGVKKAKVALTFDPPWDMSMMSEEARFALNLF